MEDHGYINIAFRGLATEVDPPFGLFSPNYKPIHGIMFYACVSRARSDTPRRSRMINPPVPLSSPAYYVFLLTCQANVPQEWALQISKQQLVKMYEFYRTYVFHVFASYLPTWLVFQFNISSVACLVALNNHLWCSCLKSTMLRLFASQPNISR